MANDNNSNDNIPDAKFEISQEYNGDRITFNAFLKNNGKDLELEILFIGAAKVYQGKFKNPDSWVPLAVFQNLKESFSIRSASNGIVVVGAFQGAVRLRCSEVSMNQQELEIKSLRAQLHLLEEKLKPAVLSMTTSKQSDKLAVQWDVEIIPLDTNYFQISNDRKVITILKSGLYVIDVQLLNVHNTVLYPYLEVNGKAVLYGYSGARN